MLASLISGEESTDAADEYELSMFTRVTEQEKCEEAGFANLKDLIEAYKRKGVSKAEREKHIFPDMESEAFVSSCGFGRFIPDVDL